MLGLLPETDQSEFEFVFDVNVYGPYRIVKAFAPLLIESEGRVVNISSMAGIMSGPGYGVYSMSKHALEAFSDALGHELGSVGVSVSAIEPGAFRSNAGASGCKRRNQQDHDPAKSLLPELAAQVAAACDDTTQYPEPDPVADVVLQALVSEAPQARYLAPSHPQQAEFMMRNLLKDLADLRSGPAYHYSREDLIALLDDALAGSEEPAVE